MLREIIREQALTNTNIMMLIDKVVVRETEELGQYNRPKLDLEIVWNTPFVNIRVVESGGELGFKVS